MRATIALAVMLMTWFSATWAQAADPAQVARPPAAERDVAELQQRLEVALSKHFGELVAAEGHAPSLKGKSAEGTTAFALYLLYELNGNATYRRAAVELALQTVKDMRATKHGVLYIKEKDKGDGASIAGGGPPALGWYAGKAAYILHHEGGHDDDVKYIATVLDNYPWSEEGWWASTIDVNTGEPKEPLSKPSIINKSAAMAMACGMVAEYVAAIDPPLAERLRHKTRKCVYEQIIPAQEADGFWHYSLSDNDPKNKDILGYFMVTVHALVQLQQFTDGYRDPVFQGALDKTYAFALQQMAPMTDPNQGPPPAANRLTPETPTHYTLSDDPKRGFALAMILVAGRHYAEGAKIADHWTQRFPYGHRGQDGAHAAEPAAIMLWLLRHDAAAAGR